MKFIHCIRFGSIAALAGLLSIGTFANTLQIVNEAEMLEFGGPQGFDAPRPLRSRNMQPSIELINPIPSAAGKVNVPFPIEVKFSTPSDSQIRPETLRILYGMLKLDITDRIRKLTQVTHTGFHLANADIPKGKHRLMIQITDDKNRTAEKYIRLEVE